VSQAVERILRVVQCCSRQTKIEQLDSMGREKHVRRFEIAMHDAAGMNGGERRQHVDGNRQRLIDTERAAPEGLIERLAFEQLHRDEEPAAVFADLVHLADVRMVDACGRLGLAPKPPA
jgi:hypothetical protein